MRRLIAITLAATLLLGVVSCTPSQVIPRLFDSIQVFAAENTNIVTITGNIMAVFYTKADHQVLFWCADATITDNGDGTWDVDSPQVKANGVNRETVEYGLYQLDPFNPHPVDDEGNEIPVYLEDLNLSPVTSEDLPHSMHVAALSDVYLVNGSPRCDVIRLYLGEQYTVTGCRVAQQAYDSYQAGEITLYDPAYGLGDDHNKDCFVLVYFVTETPFGSGDSIELPVVVDKVIK